MHNFMYLSCGDKNSEIVWSVDGLTSLYGCTCYRGKRTLFGANEHSKLQCRSSYPNVLHHLSPPAPSKNRHSFINIINTNTRHQQLIPIPLHFTFLHALLLWRYSVVVVEPGRQKPWNRGRDRGTGSDIGGRGAYEWLVSFVGLWVWVTCHPCRNEP